MNSNNSALLNLTSSHETMTMAEQSRGRESNATAGSDKFAPELQRQTDAAGATVSRMSTTKVPNDGKEADSGINNFRSPEEATSRTTAGKQHEQNLEGATHESKKRRNVPVTVTDKTTGAVAEAAEEITVIGNGVLPGPPLVDEQQLLPGNYFPLSGNSLPPGTDAADTEDTGMPADGSTRFAELRKSTPVMPFAANLQAAGSASGRTTRSFTDMPSAGGNPLDNPAIGNQQTETDAAFPGMDQSINTLLKAVPTSIELLGTLATQTEGSTSTVAQDSGQPGVNTSALLNIDKMAARLPTANEIATTASFQIDTAAGTPDWSEMVGDRIRWMNRADLASAELKLHPAELGSIEIKIFTEDQQTRVSFITSNAAAKEMIEASLPRLRELLLNSGLQLEQSDISERNNSDNRSQQQNTALTHVVADEQDLFRGQLVIPEKQQLGQIDHYV